MAGCGPLHAITFSGVDPRRGEYFVNYETYAGASGAQHDQDGKDAVRVHVSGAANLPVEAAEHEFPLNILRYELIPDSGGAGRFRGGLGTLREVANWAHDGRLVGRGLRQVVAAPGLFGGGNGRTGRFVMRDDRGEEILPPISPTCRSPKARSSGSRLPPEPASAIHSSAIRTLCSPTFCPAKCRSQRTHNFMVSPSAAKGSR